MIEQLALCGVGYLAIFFISTLNIVQVGQLLCIVGGAKVCGALKHQVLKIVSQTCGFVWVVTATRAHRDVGLNTRFFFVHRQIHGEPVFQCVDAALHYVSLHLFVGVGLS